MKSILENREESVEIFGCFCVSDFTWNQFWSFSSPKNWHFDHISRSEFWIFSSVKFPKKSKFKAFSHCISTYLQRLVNRIRKWVSWQLVFLESETEVREATFVVWLCSNCRRLLRAFARNPNFWWGTLEMLGLVLSYELENFVKWIFFVKLTFYVKSMNSVH